MSSFAMLDRLSIRLTIAFLLASILGVALVAVFAYRTTSSEFTVFLSHVEAMQQMMGGNMGGMMGNTVTLAAGDFIDNLGRTLWIAGILGIALALFLSGLFTWQIVAPLDKITVAAKRITRGELNQQVNVHGTRELVELGESFNQMAGTLKQDQESRHNLMADIAHELRTPLSILQGNVEAMQDGVIEVDEENLNSLHQETTLLTRLVDDLRTLSLMETEHLQFNAKATNLASLATQTVEGLHAQYKSKGISVKFDLSDNLQPVLVDPERTAQIIRNLFNNALYYTPNGGTIQLQLVPEPGGIIVSVTDIGPGIPCDDLPYIFDRFYRVDRSRTRSTGGSGLGLAIAKHLVEAQGGRIWVESVVEKEAPSRFSCRLRCKPTDDSYRETFTVISTGLKPLDLI